LFFCLSVCMLVCIFVELNTIFKDLATMVSEFVCLIVRHPDQ
jgi:hypothetical protein